MYNHLARGVAAATATVGLYSICKTTAFSTGIPNKHEFSKTSGVFRQQHRTQTSHHAASTAVSESMNDLKMSMLPILQSNPEVDWMVDASLNQVVEVTAKAFAGSEETAPEPIIDFGLRDICPTEFNKDRLEVYEWLFRTNFESNLNKKHIFFGHRGSNPNGEEKLASSVVLVEYDPEDELSRSRVETLINDAKELWGMLQCIPRSIRSVSTFFTFAGRFVDLKEKIEGAHQIFGPQRKHLYVNAVAMDPSFQGRGFGKQLMKQVGEAADTLGLPAYLECAGEKNPAIYRKFGFEVVHESVLGIQDDGSEVLLYHMTREPNPQADSDI